MHRTRNPTVLIAILLAGLVVIATGFLISTRTSREPIKVGVLHSDSGTMAISERSVRDATILAIEEINAAGGVLGRPLEPIVADGQSDLSVFATAARRMILEDEVSVVFGCWTSACRKTVRPIFEQHNHLLFYPIQYEGLEQSPNIVYTGAAPNQQILPAVNWCFDQLQARKFFLVGSDYVFPRTANAIIRAQVKALKGEIVGEKYILLGSDDVDDLVQSILITKPDVILNTINGDSNIAFFAALRKANITPESVPTLSFSVAEDELRSMKSGDMAGNYAAGNYYQSLETDVNREFVKRFQSRYGVDRVTDDAIEAGYFGVYLWAQAVEDAGTDEVTAVRNKLANQSFPAPQGIVSIDASNQHTWKTVRIGKIRDDGQFEIVWSSGRPLRPVSFPIYRTRQEWGRFMDDLYLQWGGQWSNPGD